MDKDTKIERASVTGTQVLKLANMLEAGHYSMQDAIVMLKRAGHTILRNRRGMMRRRKVKT